MAQFGIRCNTKQHSVVLTGPTGKTVHIPLGYGSAPYGVIVGPDGAPWVTDSGLNTIVRVDPATHQVRGFPLPSAGGYANLNVASVGLRASAGSMVGSTRQAARSPYSTRLAAGVLTESRRGHKVSSIMPRLLAVTLRG
jgi:hypothetical protein